MNNKILIISPHMDDEVLACSSFLLDESLNISIFYVTHSHAFIDEVTLNNENEELRDKCYFFKIVDWRLNNFLNKLDTIPQQELINKFTKAINTACYDTIVIPNASYNQDHRAVYEAALTAVRPHDTNHFVRKVLLFEEPESFGTLRHGQRFYPNYFRPINIDKKIDLIKTYKSQLRDHRSLDFIRSIAKLRGEQTCVPYAEAFDILRWVE